MLRLLRLLAVLLTRLFRSRRDLLLENLALRQQLSVFKRKRPQPRLALSDKLFWVVLRRLWPGWKRALILVQPETVTRIGPDSSSTGRGFRGIGTVWEESA
jgi:putative transposase